MPFVGLINIFEISSHPTVEVKLLLVLSIAESNVHLGITVFLTDKSVGGGF